MSIIRSKLKGWDINIKAEMKKKKLSLVQEISNFELLMEQRDLSDCDISVLFEHKNCLFSIYTADEIYWK
jgi:hypothetical protein